MGAPYQDDNGTWFRNNKAMDPLAVDLMNLKNSKKEKPKQKKEVGLGLNKLTLKPQLDVVKETVIKKPRPPAVKTKPLSRIEQQLKDLTDRRNRFTGGGTKMLFGD